MADTSLKIILVDEGGPVPGQAAGAAASPSAPPEHPQSGPPPSRTGGPAAQPSSQSPHPSARQPQASSGSTVASAAADLATHLANTSGLGGLVGTVRTATGLIGDFMRFTKTVSGTRASTFDVRLPEIPQHVPSGQSATWTPPIPQIPRLPAQAPVSPVPTPPPVAAGAAGNVAGAAAGAAASAGTAGAASAAGTAGAAGGPAVAGLVSAAGPVGIALAAVAVAATAAAVGVKAFAAVVKDQASKLEGYSGAVAMATSESSIRGEMAMMRRAERIGPDVAKWERMRGQASEKLTDVTTEILNQLFEIVNKFEPQITAAIEILGLLPPAIEAAGEAVQVQLDLLMGDVAGAWQDSKEGIEALKKLGKAVRDYIDDTKQQDIVQDPFIQEFFDSLPNRLAQDRRAPARPAGRRLNQDPHAADPIVQAFQQSRAAVAGGGP